MVLYPLRLIYGKSSKVRTFKDVFTVRFLRPIYTVASSFSCILGAQLTALPLGTGVPTPNVPKRQLEREGRRCTLFRLFAHTPEVVEVVKIYSCPIYFVVNLSGRQVPPVGTSCVRSPG